MTLSTIISSFVLTLLIPLATSREFPALHFPSLNTDLRGALIDTAIDSTTHIYALGNNPQTSFLIKFTPSLQVLWSLNITSNPQTIPALALDDVEGLFVAAASSSNPSSQTSPSTIHADIAVHRVNRSTGNLIYTNIVENANLVSGAAIHCTLSTSSTAAPYLFVAFLSYANSFTDSASTTIVQMRKTDSLKFATNWVKTIDVADHNTKSFGVTTTSLGGRIVVVDISESLIPNAPRQLSAYVVDSEGKVSQKATTNTSSQDSYISDIASDLNGALYVGESPRWLHRLAIRTLNNVDFLVNVWNITDIDVVDITVLKNGTAVYVLSNGDGFRNEGASAVRTKNAELSVFNESGALLSQYEHEEVLPDAIREMFSMKLIDPERSRSAVLGGLVQIPEEAPAESHISVGLFTFPEVVQEKENSEPGLQPPSSGDRPPLQNPSSNENSPSLFIGVGAGIAAFCVMVVGTILFFYKRESNLAKNENLSAAESNARISQPNAPYRRETMRNNNVLV